MVTSSTISNLLISSGTLGSFKATSGSIGILSAATSTISTLAVTSGTVTSLYIGTGGIYLPTSGGTPSILNFYEVYTDSTSNGWSGPLGAFTLNIKYVRIGETCGISFSNKTGTSSSSAAFVSSTIPTRFRPSQNFIHTFIRVSSGGTQTTPGFIIYDTTAFQIFLDATQTLFPNSTSIGFSQFSWTYVCG